MRDRRASASLSGNRACAYGAARWVDRFFSWGLPRGEVERRLRTPAILVKAGSTRDLSLKAPTGQGAKNSARSRKVARRQCGPNPGQGREIGAKKNSPYAGVLASVNVARSLVRPGFLTLVTTALSPLQSPPSGTWRSLPVTGASADDRASPLRFPHFVDSSVDKFR